MKQQLSKRQQKLFLNKWIQKIVKDETDLSVKRHIVKHVKEIYTKDSIQWVDSMRNLIEMFEAMNGIKPDPLRQLARLHNKYNKNKSRYTAPPKM